MKIRENLVSNSSSTSFIIAMSKKMLAPCKHCGFAPPNLLNQLEESSVYNDNNSVDAKGMEAVEKSVGQYFGDDWSNPREKENILEQLNKYKNSDKEVAYISISNHDETLNSLLNCLVQRDDIEIIWKSIE